MKQMIPHQRLIKIRGVCVVKLKDGQIVRCPSIKDVPEAVRTKGAHWPKDVLCTLTQIH